MCYVIYCFLAFFEDLISTRDSVRLKEYSPKVEIVILLLSILCDVLCYKFNFALRFCIGLIFTLSISDANTCEVSAVYSNLMVISSMIVFLLGNPSMNKLLFTFGITVFFSILHFLMKQSFGFGDVHLFASCSLIISGVCGNWLLVFYIFIFASQLLQLVFCFIKYISLKNSNDVPMYPSALICLLFTIGGFYIV